MCVCLSVIMYAYLGKRWVFRLDLNAEREGAERIEEGSLFQNEGPATEKERDSMEDKRSLGGIVRRH